MNRFGKLLLWLTFLLAGAGYGRAFSLLGQFPAWQTAAVYGGGFRLGYALPGDIGGPQRLNEGYRWNLPVIYYAFDKSFINYFGARGMQEIEKAIAVFNDLPAMTDIPNDSNFFYINGQRVPYDTTRVNFDAQAIGLLDIKSIAMHFIIEELGLAEPERWAWTLAGRDVITVTPPPNITNYTVFHLNFDPISLRGSPYVNGVLYGYEIFETANPNISDAVETFDVLATFPFSSVAGGNSVFAISGPTTFFSTNALFFNGAGGFYTGLTHDDVGGLRWLYNTNNLAVENLYTNVVAGTPLTGGSPWAPFFAGTNLFAVGTNFIFNTNTLVRQALRPGLNKLTFKRVNFDSLLGQTFVPVTNRYTDTYFTNGTTVIQPVERVITFPDLVFTAERLGLTGNNLVPVFLARSSTTNWANNDAINGLDFETDGGPGVIQPPIRISFSDQLPFFFNSTDFFFFGGGGGLGSIPDDTTDTRSVIWGSFDGTTSAPVIYPFYGDITIDDLRQFSLGGGN